MLCYCIFWSGQFHTDDVKSVRNPSEALIGRRSSYIVLAIVYE